jgi:hypothetical protein
MTTAGLHKKLRILPGQRMLVINAPPGYLDAIGGLPEGSALEQSGKGPFDFVHLFVREAAELETMGPAARSAVTYDGILWFSYPKLSSGVASDLSRDIVARIGSGLGLRAVAQVSIDEVWSAIRFRPSA